MVLGAMEKGRSGVRTQRLLRVQGFSRNMKYSVVGTESGMSVSHTASHLCFAVSAVRKFKMLSSSDKGKRHSS